MLFIRGERKPEEGRRYLYNGRSYGRFERVITLPEAVNADEVQATLNDGVLRDRPAQKPRGQAQEDRAQDELMRASARTWRPWRRSA